MNRNFKDWLFLDEMLTPKIINIIYWLILFFMLISGLAIMFSGITFFSFIGGMLTIIMGAVGARIWCELLIVIFKIHENLRKLADK